MSERHCIDEAFDAGYGSNFKPVCKMCDGTGLKDYASFCMEPCDHRRDIQAPTVTVEDILNEIVEAYEGIASQLDCDCPDLPDEDSIGWQGGEEMPVTFGQLRRFIKAIDQAKSVSSKETKTDSPNERKLKAALLSLILFTKPSKFNAAALANAYSVLEEVGAVEE